MNFSFLFWLFFVGIIVALFQDLKRREVDDWLNLFLVITSLVFIFIKSVFERDPSLIFQAGFSLVILFILMNFFYYSRIFSGGDAKLLFSMSVFFIGASFFLTLINIGTFILALMISGSIYGLIYSFILYFKNFKEINRLVKKEFIKSKVGLFLIMGCLGCLLILLGFFNFIFIMMGFIVLIFPLLYIFARCLENVSMIKEISGKNLREGDLLVENVKVGKRIIMVNWEGLSSNEIKALENLKKVKIKEGIPFVPAFLMAFILYDIFNEALSRIFLGLI
tara:strand:- start:2718 stop:3554 length:837 start_codon:yes stop_codon:yes gene_type:complete